MEFDMYRALPLMLLLCTTVAFAQNAVPFTNDPTMYKRGYDIPAGVEHGTWDFDEWPGIDHKVVYKKEFRYGDANEKIKIDYGLSVFDANDHEGYLKSSDELFGKFASMHDVVAKAKSIVGVFAHPDDEILLAGGLFAYAAERGLKAKIYLLSNGADGGKGFSNDIDPALGGYNCASVMTDGSIRVTTDLMGKEKVRIFTAYAKSLGVSIEVLPVRLTFDGKPVVQMGEYPGLDFKKSYGPGTELRTAMEAAVREMLLRERPEIIVTHGRNGEYGNYFHKTVHTLVVQAAAEARRTAPNVLFTGFPEYNTDDRITHVLDLDRKGQARQKKWDAFRGISFVFQDGNDYDKPWNPDDDLMDGVFVKDYGYTPEQGKPPRYEYFQLMN